jgi:predicted ester cyclase
LDGYSLEPKEPALIGKGVVQVLGSGFARRRPKQFAATYRQAFPDLQNTVEDMVAEGDKVVVRFRARGTHQGETEAFGSPMGKRMDMTGITIKRLSDGKIVEAWTNFDALGMMQQLGLIPEAAAQA